MSETQNLPAAAAGPKPEIGNGQPQKRAAVAPVTVSSRRNAATTFDLDPSTMQDGRHYHFFRKDEADMSKARMRGYTPVDPNDKEAVKTLVDPNIVEGRVEVAGMVLMSCDKDMYENHQRAVFRRSEELLASTTAATEQEAAAKGVTIIKDKE